MKRDSKRTYQEAQKWASSFLNSKGKEGAAAYHYLLDLLDWTPTQYFDRKDQDMPQDRWVAYYQGLHRMAEEDYPYQYLVNRAWFYGQPFYVNEATLIPRQETEGIIDLVRIGIETEKVRPDGRVWDLGTGSGILAITLKKLFPNMDIVATDISQPALEVAQKNAKTLHAAIEFRRGDLFEPVNGLRFDLVVTNPPYVGTNETGEMGADVLKYEPKQALFAGAQGLDFYQRLTDQLDNYLEKGACFIGECGYHQGPALEDMFVGRFPSDQVQVRQDLAGLDRYIVLKKEG